MWTVLVYFTMPALDSLMDTDLDWVSVRMYVEYVCTYIATYAHT